MRFVVCCKQVPDTSARLRVEPGKLEPHRGGLLPVINPYDEFALEQALRQGDRGYEVEVVLVLLSPEPVEESVFHGLAMGADRAIVLRVPQEPAAVPLMTARMLASEIRPLAPDLVFCGERAVDDDAAQVGPLLAEALGMPQICGAEGVELDSDRRAIRATCRRPRSAETYRCELPCLISFVRGDSLPRYPSLDDVLSAGEKRVETRQVSIDSPPAIHRISLTAPREARTGLIINEDPKGAVERLLSDPDGLASFL